MDNAIVKSFCIHGLYGYKNVRIDFAGNQLILIAGNGSGKTTILNALYALLTRQHFRLRALDFRAIECEFYAGDKVVVAKEQLSSIQPNANERISRIAIYAGMTSNELTDFVANEFRGLGPNWRYHPTISGIYSSSPWDYEEIWRELTSIETDLSISEYPELKAAFETISLRLEGCEVLYLPTYRRIENPQLSPKIKRSRSALQGVRKSQDLTYTVFGEQMNFGLEDVEERLNQLSEEVDRIANAEYRSSSATIIDDALDDKIISSPTEKLPDIDSLRVFLSRVSDQKLDPRRGRKGENVSERRVKAINELYFTGDVAKPEYQILRYFLSRLGKVIERTKETETMLQKFVDACNGYLQDSIDEKLFIYDKDLMKVAVINSWTSKEIELSQLSSGEKQIVSILAKLYLYDKKKIVLIDEPELSLSIDWQRKILPDLMRSGSVRQLLAITHSPFVFENELDPFAGSLQVSREKQG